MISQDLQALIPKFLRTTRIIWIGFLGAPIFYGVIAQFVVQGTSEGYESSLPPEAFYVLVLISIASGPLFIWSIAPRIASPEKLVAQGGSVQLVTEFGENQARYERLGEREKKKARHLGAIQASFIVQWAGAESVAVYGLLGVFTGVLSLYGAWVFFAAAILMLWILRPDYEAALENLDV